MYDVVEQKFSQDLIDPQAQRITQFLQTLGITIWGIFNGLKVREFIAIQDGDIERQVFSVFPYSEAELKDQAKKTR